MTGTRKVNKDMSFGNNLILENDLGLLSVSIYTELNGIVLILGFGFFISLVNCCLILQLLSLEPKQLRLSNRIIHSGRVETDSNKFFVI